MNTLGVLNGELAKIGLKYAGDALICMGLFGSRARNEESQHSDVDVFIVTKRTLSITQTLALKTALKDIATNHGLSYDNEFPVELITQYDLRLALNGYGFVVNGNQVQVSTIGPTDWTQFNSYRQWLAVFATPNIFLAGNGEAYEQFTADARHTMLKLALNTTTRTELIKADLQQVMIRNGKKCFGFVDSAFTKNYISQVYGPMLDELCECGELERVDNIYRIENREILLPSAVKTQAQYTLEQHYLGVHDTAGSVESLMAKVGNITNDFLTQKPLEYLTQNELRTQVNGWTLNDNTFEESISELLQYSVKQNHPRYMAFPDAGNAKAAMVGAWLEPVLNQNMIAVDKSAPIATFIEANLISRLRSMVGYDHVPHTSALDLGGIATSGGIGSNAVALLVARSKAYPNIRHLGQQGVDAVPYLLISDKTLEHYSHGAAFWWLGMGEKNVIPVKSNRYQFDLDDLSAKLKYYNQDNRRVVAVVALAGDSRTLTIQNLSGIEPLIKKYNTWLHLDACHGGVGLFSSARDQICADFKLADSISLDPHKGLALPYASSYCLFKDPTALQLISKSTDITIAKGSYDMGQVTPFVGSRPFDSIKLWSLLSDGLDSLQMAVDYRIQLAKVWADLLKKSRYFEPMHEPQLTAVAFSIDSRKIGMPDVGALNKGLHDAAYKDGWAIIHSFDLVDYNNALGMGDDYRQLCLGVNFGNVQLDIPTLGAVLNYLEDVVEELLAYE